MNRVVVFLQNAWSPLYAGDTWPRRSWLRALARSRSGKRLLVLLEGVANLDVCENTTPFVGATADSVVPANVPHIEAVLRFRTPKVVVCCGRQALESIVPLHKGPLLHVPHPTWRPLTDAAYKLANHVLRSGTFSDRVTLRWSDHEHFAFEPLSNEPKATRR